MDIDVDLDLSIDANGRDPDLYSPTLLKYHKLLWSKPLPNGQVFHLRDDIRGSYLVYESDSIQIKLGSDSISNSYSNSQNKKIRQILQQVSSEDIVTFRNCGSTIGGYIVFPSTKIDGQMSINQARGFNPFISDRFDLTLECIKRFYCGFESPLTKVLEQNEDFFRLFIDFRGYVNFFLLNDLVKDNYEQIDFFLPVNVFNESPLPRSIDEYDKYRFNTMNFVRKRNQRIAELNK